MLKILYFLFLFLVVEIAVAKTDPSLLTILSRESTIDSEDIYANLTEHEKNWLNNKSDIVLAVQKEDYPPHDITYRSNGNYEGLTADVVGLISIGLKKKIIVKIFPSRSEALLAVKNGSADFVGFANDFEATQELSLTNRYIDDRPSLYSRAGVKVDDIKNLAVPMNYLPDSFLKSHFPDKKIIYYPTVYSAVASVIYQNSDAVLVDTISANFLVNKLYQSSLQQINLLPYESKGFAFAVEKNNTTLVSILNKAIGRISTYHKDNIIKRWSGGGISLSNYRLNLTEEQLAYLKKKKKIKIRLSTRAAPFSYLDANGNFRGIVADIVQGMRLSLGVDIDVQLTDSPDLLDQVHDVTSGQSDLTLLNFFSSNSYSLLATNSIVLDPLVYVLRKEDLGKFKNFSEVIDAGVIAIRKGGVSETILDYYKDKNIKVLYTNTLVTCVLQKDCISTIYPLRFAQYIIENRYSDSLVIAGELYDSQPMPMNFAARKEDKILVDILNKYLESLPPNEIDMLPSRWRVSPAIDEISMADIIRHYGTTLILVAITIVMMALWSISLRIQNKKRKIVETKLKQQLKFMGELVDSIPHPIFARDEKGNLILCNSSFATFVGSEKSSLLGNKYSDMPLSKQTAELLSNIYDTIYKTGQPYEKDHSVSLADGRSFQFYFWLHAYRDLLGNIAGVVGGWLDISERHKLLEELSDATRQAKEANRAKTTFLATMSHEIRTPMNAVIGLLELTLKKGGIDEEARESIVVAHNSAHDLLELIGDILDISKIESEKLHLTPSPNSIAELSRSVINVFNANAREKGLTLTCNIIDDQVVMIDPMRYKQIISNLISNAIKYTQEGSVNLELNLYREEDICHITINITDTGIGISKQDQARLFQPFSQVSQPAELQRSGTGLGLMICQALCQMMGGSLELKSELEKGTTVSVYLRLPVVESINKNAQINHIEKLNDTVSQSYNILIVDDHPTNRLLVSQQLAYLGHRVSMATSGIDALQQLENRVFDIIITDFNMPDMNGFEFTLRYRAQEIEEHRKRSVIIGLTADARQEQIERATEVGIDDCLFKPVSLDELKHCIDKVYP